MEKWRIRVTVFAVIALVSACATNAAQPVAQPTTSVKSDVPTKEEADLLSVDFAAATAEACAPVSATDASPIDPAACQCNKFLAEFVPSLKPQNSGDVKGPISAVERLRVLRIRAQASNARLNFQMACGALFMQIRDDALSVAAFIGMLGK